MVEGHADSRGTNEYNLALAENRADAVRDYLVGLGLANDRVTVVSKGEEQPFCTGRDGSLLAAESGRVLHLHRQVGGFVRIGGCQRCAAPPPADPRPR